MRLLRLLAAVLVLVAVPLGSSALAGELLDRAAGSLASDPVYVDPSVSELVPASDVAEIRARVRGADPPVYVAVLPAAVRNEVRDSRQLAAALARTMGARQASVLVLTPQSLSAYSGTASRDVAQLANSAVAAVRSGTPIPEALTGLVDGVVGVTSGTARGADRVPGAVDDGRQAQPAGSGGGAGLALLTLLAAGGLGVALFARRRARRRRQEEAETFADVRSAAEEDVTRLGEDISGLDLDLADPRLDEATRGDYRHALDAYDTSKAALEAARRPEDLQAVSQALEDGRYAMACVRARLSGQSLPERRPPCFFNPQHGPSVTDMTWAPMGGAEREVPVCAADAERLRRGEDPEAREVMVGGVRRPYWEAGPAYGPWAGGYYGGYGGGLLPGLLIGTMLGGSFGGFGLGGYGAGYTEGFEAGEAHDGGGWGDGPFGGGDFGGGDFGGGDFGGGDFGGGN